MSWKPKQRAGYAESPPRAAAEKLSPLTKAAPVALVVVAAAARALAPRREVERVVDLSHVGHRLDLRECL